MSVILTNIGMPNNCRDCRLQDCPILDIYSDNNFDCVKKEYITSRHKDCPLKSVEGLIEKFERIAEKSEDAFGYGGCVFSTIRIAEIIKEYCGVKE